MIRKLGDRLLSSRSMRQLASNAGWLLGERVIRLGLGVGVNIWIARYLGVTQFGLLNYAIAFALLFRGMASGGLDGIVTRELVSKRSDPNEVMGSAFLIRAIAGAIAFVVTLICGGTMHSGNGVAFWIILASAMGTLFLAMDVIDFWFQSRVESKFVVMARGGAFVLAQIASVILILLKGSPVMLAVTQGSELLLAAAGLAFFYHQTGGQFRLWKPNTELAWKFLQTSWPLILSGMGVIIYMKTAQIVLGQIKGNHEVGIYSVAARLAEVWYFLPTLIASSAFPKLVESHDQSEKLYVDRLQKLLNLMSWLALAIAVPTCLLSNTLVRHLYGAEFARAGTMLSIHIWGCCFVFMGTILSKTLVIEGIYIFSLIRHALGAAVNIGLNLILIPKYGGVGASIATVVSYATASYLSSFVYRPTFRSGFQMTRALLQPILVPAAFLASLFRQKQIAPS